MIITSNRNKECLKSAKNNEGKVGKYRSKLMILYPCDEKKDNLGVAGPGLSNRFFLNPCAPSGVPNIKRQNTPNIKYQPSLR